MMTIRLKSLLVSSLLWLYIVPAYAYKDDIGYTRLMTELGVNLATGGGVLVSQTEADADGVAGPPYQYFPDLSNTQFSGKIITNVSNINDTPSGHATMVGTLFYGNNAMAHGITNIDVYETNSWLQGDFLMFGSGLLPLASTNRVGNHSWVGSTGIPSYDSEILRRLDWVVENDDFVQFVGGNNSTGLNNNLLSGAFNITAVGKTNGLHSTGTRAIDSSYVTGRSRPEIVAPLDSTSAATPVVASTAAILIDLAHNNTALSNGSSTSRSGNTIYHAENSETIKASLLAGANRFTRNTNTTANITDYRADTANQSPNGLDRRFGAGQINIYNSYHIIAAGEQNSQQDGGTGNISANGFDYDPSFGGASGSNITASYYFSSGASSEIFYASLAWNIDIASGNRFFDGTATLHDLDLMLYDVTGSQTLVTSSSSNIDNSENLWVTLPAGRNYMLQVVAKAGQSSFNWDYALAWRSTSDIDSDMIPDNNDNCPSQANPSQADFDNDGMGDICDADDDNDTLSDTTELMLGSDPFNADTDGDGLNDGQEVNLYGTSPINPDSDGDGLQDGEEISYGFDPTQSDKGRLAPRAAPDNVLNAADMLVLYRIIEGVITPTSIEAILADMNNDGKIDVIDALLLQKIVL